MRRSQAWPGKEVRGPVVVKPVFLGLEARNDRVAGCPIVLRCMLIRRVIATADVSASRAAPEVKPPAIRCQALGATRPARFSRGIDAITTVHFVTLHDRSDRRWECLF